MRRWRADGQAAPADYEPRGGWMPGSSNVAWIFARSCNNRTCEVPLRPGSGSISNSHHPSSEGTAIPVDLRGTAISHIAGQRPR
jgi:hypothetical protein